MRAKRRHRAYPGRLLEAAAWVWVLALAAAWCAPAVAETEEKATADAEEKKSSEQLQKELDGAVADPDKFVEEQAAENRARWEARKKAAEAGEGGDRLEAGSLPSKRPMSPRPTSATRPAPTARPSPADRARSVREFSKMQDKRRPVPPPPPAWGFTS